MNPINILRYALLLVFVLVFSGCTEGARQEVWFDSFHNIPEITEEQIEEIEQIINMHEYFLYGMLQNDEAFHTIDGQVVGFSAEVCEWLTGLFGITFTPVIFDELPDLMAALESGEVHFTGQLPVLPAFQDIFAFTDPISKRSVAIARPFGSRPLADIEAERSLRFAFMYGSALANVLNNMQVFDAFETIMVENTDTAAVMLLSGYIDAYIGDGVLTLATNFPGFRVEPFYPFIFGYASFASRNQELFPIVEAVQKVLENGGMSILARLYARGREDVSRHRLSLLLTDEERDFIAANPVIPIAAHGFIYPISFLSPWEIGIHGIAFDILQEVESITGLRFEIINQDVFHSGEVNRLLLSGEAYMATGAFRPGDMGDDSFLLSSGFFLDRYALLSYGDMPIIGVNEVLYMDIALVGDGIYDYFFHRMFPNHINTIRFDLIDDALEALESGEAHLIFTSLRRLYRANHLLERPGFRANIIFDEYYHISFAINENKPLLASIINNTLLIIDTETISADWIGRTFDFTATVLREQRPWLIGTIVLLLVVLILLTFLFYMLRKRQAMIHAEESNLAKTRFLARMSHEIRTPITAVLGISEIELRNASLTGQAEDSFAKINDSAKTLLSIVNDILDFSKIESGKLPIIIEEYEVASLINDVAQIYIIYLEEKNVSFKMQIDEDLPARLTGDNLRIRQIINNLMSNAFKYTEKGSVTLSVSYEENNVLNISIKDTGFGMTNKQVESLKNSEYLRFHEQEERFISGTGLGIPIVYSLVNIMHGKLDIKSEVGKGTTVTVRIPQKASSDKVLGSKLAASLQQFEANLSSAKKKSEFTPEPMPYGKVLVVDDVDANLFVASGLLNFYGLTIETCTNGQDAIDKVAKGNEYDIIFMDYLMPGLNGIESMQIIKDSGYSLPIVALTANALVGQAEEFIAGGFDDFVSKPIQALRLNEVLNKFIRDKQPPEVIKSARANQYINAGQIKDFMDRDDIAEKLRTDFAKSHKDTFSKIVIAITDNDNETAIRLAHTIKGSAGLIREDKLMQLSEEVESLLRDKETPDSSLMSNLEREINTVLSAIGKPKSEDFANKQNFDKEKALAIFDKLEPLLSTKNAESLSHVNELKTIPETALMVRQIEEFEFGMALQILRGLRVIFEEF